MKNIIKKRSFLNAVAAYLIGTILVRGIGLFTTPIFTRILSTTDFGILSVFQTWVNCFAVFIGLQVSGSIATARIHLGQREFNSYLKNILLLSFLAFACISTVCLLFRNILADLLELSPDLILFLLIQSFGSSCATFYISYTIQTKQPKKNVIFSVALVLSNVALSIPLILYLDEDKYMGRVIAGTFINVVLSVYVYVFFFKTQKVKVEIRDWKYAIPLSVPLIAHLLSNVLIGQSDRLFIVKYLGYKDAAIYSVAYTIGSIGVILTEASNNVWSPWYLDNTKAKNIESINARSKTYVIVVVLIFSWIMFCAPEIMSIMAPATYSLGTKSLIIVAAAVFFKFLYRFPLAYEQYAKNLKWVAVATVVSLLVNVLFNYFLIPFWGMFGAAVSTLITYVVLFGIHEYVARIIIKGYNIDFKNYIPGIVIVALISVSAFFLVHETFLRFSILIGITLILITSIINQNIRIIQRMPYIRYIFSFVKQFSSFKKINFDKER